MTLVDPKDLLASSDVAVLLGVSKPAVSNYKKRHPDFPAPIATVGRGTVDLYLRSQVVAWARSRMAPELLAALTEQHQQAARELQGD